MSNEANVNVSLQIQKDNLSYRTPGASFSVDVTGTFGPTPGAVLVSTSGTDINLNGLSVPGLCHLRNLDVAGGNYVEYGVREPATNTFYPLGEIGPGESYVLKLSRNVRQEYDGTGTGTSPPTNYFHIKANGSAVTVVIEAFER